MGRKFKVWCDSGANIHSNREQMIDLEILGVEDEWDSMTDDQRDEVMKDVAWDRLDWGYQEIGKDDEE